MFSKYKKIDEWLFEWLKEKMQTNIPFNGAILEVKAESSILRRILDDRIEILTNS